MEHEYKVDDHVALVQYLGFSREKHIQKRQIVRTTKTLVVLDCGRKFLAASGREGGAAHGYFRPRLEPWTPEIEAEAKQIREALAARKKCRVWAERLESAKGDDAIRLAAMLPELPQ